MTGKQDGRSLAGQSLEQLPDLNDAGRVQSIDGFIQDQQGRLVQ
jgi:hypothetical protein